MSLTTQPPSSNAVRHPKESPRTSARDKPHLARSVGIIAVGAALFAACSSTANAPANTTAPPTSEIPSTEVPATDPPATETPNTETPNTETPNTETPNTETPNTETPSTEPRATTADSTPDTVADPVENPLEIDALVAALELAADTVSGVPYEAEYEVDDDDGGPFWEITLAADGVDVEVRVNAAGTAVISEERDDDLDDDAVLLDSIEISAVDALHIIAPVFSGRVEELEIDRRGADIVWEIELRRDDDTSFDVIVDAVSGAVLDDDAGRPGAAATPADLDAYVEYATIQQELPAIGDLDATVETDNPNSRVILFGPPEGRPLYKSIFIKQPNRLKLIDLSGGGPPIFDATL